jgi:hypothetical protein
MINVTAVEIEELLNKNQGFSIEFIKENIPFKDKEINERVITDLRKAGLPEHTPKE